MAKIANVRNFLRKAFKFGLFIPLSNLVLTYGGRFLPYGLVRCISDCRNDKVQEAILRVVGRSVFETGQHGPASRKEDDGNRRIWYCWMQGETALPAIPRLCLESIRKHSSGHDVVFIDAANYHEYVSLPAGVTRLYSEGKLKQAHFADIMRVNLLAQQGGLWIDATMLVTSDLPAEIFSMPFFSIKTKEIGHYVSRCRWAVFCLGGEEGGLVFRKVAELFDKYLSNTDVFVDYFMFDHFIELLYNHNDEVRRIIDGVPENNANVHQLNRLLCYDFDAGRYAELTRDTYMFKLSWKTYSTKQLTDNPGSYYNYLCKNL